MKKMKDLADDYEIKPLSDIYISELLKLKKMHF